MTKPALLGATPPGGGLHLKMLCSMSPVSQGPEYGAPGWLNLLCLSDPDIGPPPPPLPPPSPPPRQARSWPRGTRMAQYPLPVPDPVTGPPPPPPPPTPGKVLATGHQDGSISLYNVEKCEVSTRDSRPHTAPITALSWVEALPSAEQRARGGPGGGSSGSSSSSASCLHQHSYSHSYSHTRFFSRPPYMPDGRPSQEGVLHFNTLQAGWPAPPEVGLGSRCGSASPEVGLVRGLGLGARGLTRGGPGV